jgi:hypothetical protein
MRVSADMNAQSLASILSAMANLGWEPRLAGLAEALEVATLRLLSSMSPIILSFSMRAMTTLQWRALLTPKLCAALANTLVRVLPAMSSEDLMTSVCAMAAPGWSQPLDLGLKEALESKGLVQASAYMSGQAMARIVTAMGMLDWLPAPQVRKVLERDIVRVSTSMSAQEVANTVLAMASLSWQLDHGPHEALESAVLRVVASMSAQDLASTLWAMATLRWKPLLAGLQEVLEAATLRLASSMNEEDVTNTLWSLATLGWQPKMPALRSALEAVAEMRQNNIGIYDARRISWARTKLGWQTKSQSNVTSNVTVADDVSGDHSRHHRRDSLQPLSTGCNGY